MNKNILYITEHAYLDISKCIVYSTADQTRASLTTRQCTLFAYLLENPNRKFSTFDLSEYMESRFGKHLEEESIDKYITRIRKELRKVMSPEEIHAVLTRKDGYYVYNQPEAVIQLKPLELRTHFSDTAEEKRLPSNLSFVTSRYCERNAEENAIINLFMMNKENVVFLSGEPGIGKKELAVSVGRRLSSVMPVARIVYENSMYDTIMRLYPEFYAINENALFEKKCAALVKTYSNALLIIDQFYDPARTFAQMRSEESFRRLLGSNIRMLVLTCYRNTGEFPMIRVPKLPMEDLLVLMRNSGAVHENSERLQEIAELCGYNTLLCVQIAKLLGNPFSSLSRQEILNILQTGNVSDASMKIAITDKREVEFEETLYMTIYRLCKGISLSDPERLVLSAMCLLPHNGMPLRTFRMFMQCADDTLSSLANKGLIELDDEKNIQLNRLYALYFNDLQNRKLLEECDLTSFLNALFQYYSQGDLRDRSLCVVIANVLEKRWLERKEIQTGVYAANYIALLGRYNRAWQIEKECVDRVETTTEKDLQVVVYKNYAISCGRLNYLNDAVTYLEKALEILRATDRNKLYYQTMNSLAYVYGKKRDYEKQRSITLHIMEEMDSQKYAVNYVRTKNNYAEAQYHLKQYSEAKVAIEDVIVKYGELNKTPLIWMIQAKHLHAKILYRMGMQSETESLLKQLIRESEVELGNDHLETIRLYSLMGDVLPQEQAKHYYRIVVQRSLCNDDARSHLFYDGQCIHFFSEHRTAYRLYGSFDLPAVQMEEDKPHRIIVDVNR